MSYKLKILVIRFSSIGDIILTTPVLRCLKIQKNAEIHFLTKKKYTDLLLSNPNVSKIITQESYSSNGFINDLKNEKFDYIIDLQNNFKSFKLKLSLQLTSFTISKRYFQRILFIWFGINLLRDHIVERYFRTLKPLNIVDDNKGLDYFIDSETRVNFNFKSKYITWNLGASYIQKKLSLEQLKGVIEKLQMPVVLIGGSTEVDEANYILKNISSKKIFNFCGKLTISQSALLIKYSQLLLTNDSAMMHIGASFNVPIISFWGCTKPSLGFTPYKTNNMDIQLSSKNSSLPCSRHGSYCKYTKKGCVKSIDVNEIYNAVLSVTDK